MGMSESQVQVFLDDGPRAGETLAVQPGPEGQPPHELVISDPLGEGGRAEESFDVGGRTVGSTTYHLHGRDEQRDLYLYRTGRPN
jgi:hypothetical protein